LNDIYKQNLFIKPVIIISFFIFFIQYAYSQDIQDNEQIEFKACIFLNVNLSLEESSDYEMIISDIISVEMSDIGFSIIEPEIWRKIAESRGLSNTDLLISRNAISVAKEAGADIAITGFYYIEESAIIIDFKCYSVLNERLIASHIDSGRIGLSVHNLIYAAVEEMLPKILSAKQDIGQITEEEQEIIKQDSYFELTFLSEQDGMEIYLTENNYLGTITDGKLVVDSIPFNIGTEIKIIKKMEGYHTEEVSLLLDEKDMQVKLQPLFKETKLAAEIIWTTGQFFGLGMGMRYYFKPNSFFISSDDYFYFQYGFNDRSSPVFHNDLRILLGKYLFFPFNSIFRIGVSSGFGCIFSFYSIPEKGLYTDFYLNYLNIWTEWNIKKWAIFLRLEGKYTLGLGKNLLGTDFFGSKGYGPPVTIGVIRKW
jgi:hypothetical protein